MSKLRVDEVQGRAQAQVTPETSALRRRKDLHTRSSFDGVGPQTFSGIGRPDLSALKQGAETAGVSAPSEPKFVTLADGRQLEIPRLSAAERERIESIYAKLSPEGAATLKASAMALGQAVWGSVEAESTGLKVEAASASLDQAAQQTYETYLLTTGETQANAASEGVLFVGMNGVEQDLYGFVTKMQDRQNAATECRTDVNELEAMLADWPAGEGTQLFSYREVVMNADGTTSLIEHKNVPLTKEQAIELLKKLKQQQDTVGSMSAQDSYQLQIKTEHYQQAMNTLSNILKAQEDTRKGIIGNIRA